MCGYCLDEDTAARLWEIREHLRLYEDDAAEDLLRRLIAWLEEQE